MDRVELVSKVGPDGVLRLAVPLPTVEANREVRVTVEPVPPPPMTQEEWRETVMRFAGSIADPQFRRWDQGQFEERESLS
jgi:hypothetical protein